MPNRYQNQPWYVRLWRRRYTLPVPYRAVRSWLKLRGTPMFDDPEWRDWTLRDLWRLEIGSAHGQMKWYFSWDEVKQHLEERRSNR